MQSFQSLVLLTDFNQTGTEGIFKHAHGLYLISQQIVERQIKTWPSLKGDSWEPLKSGIRSKSGRSVGRTDGRADGRTDRQTDRNTHRQLWSTLA